MKTLIVYLHGIGDSIMLTPTLKHYQQHHQTEIGVLCLPLTAPYWNTLPYVHHVHPSKHFTTPPHHGNWIRYLKERITIQKEINHLKHEHHYDSIEYIVPHSWRILNLTIPIPGIIRRTITIPFEHHEILKLSKRLHTQKGLRWPDDYHQDLILTKHYEQQALQTLKKLSIKKPFCILHTVASSPNKSLTQTEKDELISLLKNDYDVCLLQEPTNRTDVKLIITDNIMTSAAIIKHASLYVSIDSGPAHIAEALNIPRIIITKAGFKSKLLYLPATNAFLLDNYDKDTISTTIRQLQPNPQSRYTEGSSTPAQ